MEPFFFDHLFDFEIVCTFFRQFTRNDREQTNVRVKWNSVVFWCKEELLPASSANFSKGILALWHASYIYHSRDSVTSLFSSQG